MSAGRYDMVCEVGATFRRVITWKGSTGALIDLTGYSAEIDVRPQPASSVVLLTLSTTNARIALGGAAGTITLLVAATVTALLEPQDGVYDLILTDTDGAVTRLLEGDFHIRARVTR